MKHLQKIVLSSLTALAALCACSSPATLSPELKATIEADTRLDSVSARAQRLVASGLNAGDGYEEVWIRDLNTFITLSCEVGNKDSLRESLIRFFKFQAPDGNIADGYIRDREGLSGYDYRRTPLLPGLAAHKNTVETDQESSLIQAVYKYIQATGDRALLDEQIESRTIRQRMELALQFLLTERYDDTYGLLWGATTADWGDVQPEHPWGVAFDESSHKAIDIYDQAMFLIAVDNYLSLVDDKEQIARWQQIATTFRKNVRQHLWDGVNNKYIPHIYLNGSPFADSIDERAIHYHGGTAVAIEAGLHTPEEVLALYQTMERNRLAAHAGTIGLTLHPTYPAGAFLNEGMHPYGYQNGGDWTWFGARMIRQLVRYGYYDEAYKSLEPMVDRVLKNNGFFEWWTPDGQPKGSGSFRGSAGVLWDAIRDLRAAAKGNNEGV